MTVRTNEYNAAFEWLDLNIIEPQYTTNVKKQQKIFQI